MCNVIKTLQNCVKHCEMQRLLSTRGNQKRERLDHLKLGGKIGRLMENCSTSTDFCLFRAVMIWRVRGVGLFPGTGKDKGVRRAAGSRILWRQ